MPGHEETFAGYIGQIVVSHETNYLCVALENDALLLLQLLDNGTPLQFIVAHHPDLYNEELVWSNGDYFPFFAYQAATHPLHKPCAIRDLPWVGARCMQPWWMMNLEHAAQAYSRNITQPVIYWNV